MNAERMEKWKRLMKQNETDFQTQLDKMDHREDVYRGKQEYKALVKGDEPIEGKLVKYCYNAAAETVEAQVSSEIPMPKVTARRKQDEHLAEIIEQMLRNELDRLPMELINDIEERTVPVQGGGYYLLEWDNRKRTQRTVGENCVSWLHPKMVIPQAGVYSDVQDMDYVFLKIPQTKAAILARYGVDVSMESETEPELKDAEGGERAEDMVTQYVAYYRNENGGIGLYSWCNNSELEDLDDYQARRMKRCAACGALQPGEGTIIADGTEEPREWKDGDPCPECGAAEWRESEEDYDETAAPLRSDGMPVDDMGGEMKIPYYKPNQFPLFLQKNVSVFGQLLGESDIDKLESMQDGLNRLNKKIFDRMLKAGTKITLPPDPSIRIDPEDGDVIRLNSVEQKAYVDAYTFTGNLEQELYWQGSIYSQMRQLIGVTDSFQGRTDSTAVSGKAKEFSAAQAAGRMESKRVMKQAAYAALFEAMFKWRLAYADEPRPVVYQDSRGDTVYDSFNKWDFLERDEAGMFYWNDQFLFSCDTSAPLAQNRERMWQEITTFFQAGAFGDPKQTQTLIEYWRKMELEHYPGAGETRKNMQERMEREQMQQMQQADQPMQDDGQVEEMAKQKAMEDAVSGAAAQAAYAEVGG